MNEKRYYIAYGSNLNVRQMRMRCPHATILGTANLKDWELLFKGSRTGSYLTIEECENGPLPTSCTRTGRLGFPAISICGLAWKGMTPSALTRIFWLMLMINAGRYAAMKNNITRMAVCPLCGRTYHGAPALSREDNETLICPDCGTRQALQSIGVDSAEQEQIIETIHRHTQE